MMEKVTDIVAICNPAFIIEAPEEFRSAYIKTKTSEIISSGKFEYKIDQNYRNDTLEISVKVKSDLYLFTEAQDWNDYVYRLQGNVSLDGGEDVPFY